ncbi:MAG: bile acid:sodium symporter family protein [Candidatus Nitrosocosmicus sp.]
MNEPKVNNRAFYLLIFAISTSTVVGILFPQVGLVTEPYLLLWLGLLLLFNLIKMNLQDLYMVFANPTHLIVLTIFKLIAIPCGLYALMTVIQLIGFFPLTDEVKLSVFLLSGISTGLGSPFVVNFVGGKLPVVVGLIISSSLVVPFTLPLFVFLFFKDKFAIPIFDMIFLLMVALITPLLLSQLIKKYTVRMANYISNNSQIYSLIFIFLINLSIFATYSGYFFSNPVLTFENIMLTFGLFGFFALAGFGIGKVLGFRQDGIMASIISMTYINNILIVVFAHHFFGAEIAALAAFFNIPYYVGILILKKIIPSKSNFHKVM